MACEMFVLGTRDFRLPGLGSYLQTAAGNGDGVAIGWGLVTMIAIIVATDQFIWRPIIAWSDKFKFEQVESGAHVWSPLLHMLQSSNALRSLSRHTTVPLSERFYRRNAEKRQQRIAQVASGAKVSKESPLWLLVVVSAVALVVVSYAAFRALGLLREVQLAQFTE